MVIVVLGVLASLGLAFGAPAGTASTASAPTDCGDIAGPVWHVFVTGERKGATGSHYTVTGTNMPCAKARALTAKLIRLRAPGRGFDKKILSGYTCLNPISNAPAGSLFFGGGCVVGAAVIPVPAASAFNWHPCQLVKTRTRGTLHPTCKWAYYTLG